MKSLKTIQTLAKIGKVLSKIGFIFCIIGFCGCIVGIIGLIVGAQALSFGGVTLHGIIEEESGMGLPSIYAATAAGILFCAGEAVLCRFAETYFKNELDDGTPFTLRGAKELLRLGILTVAIPLGTAIICSIGVAVARILCPGIEDLSFDGYGSVALGVSMIVLSLFCRYGAELREGNAEKTGNGSV